MEEAPWARTALTSAIEPTRNDRIAVEGGGLKKEVVVNEKR
jgi:hypothetical protein